MKVYYALVHKDEGSAYGIMFPDLPGCFGAADAEGDIHEAAQSALVLYVQDASMLPEPRSVSELQADIEIKSELVGGAALLAVPLMIVERKARYNVMLDVDLVAGVDREARMMGISRSDFLAVSVQERLKSQVKAAIVQGGKISFSAIAASGMAKTESTGKKTASAASKVLTSKTASKSEKMVAASALAQTKSKDVTSKAVASTAAKVLKDPKASAAAKSAAASALTQAPNKKPAAKKT